jgi:cell division protein FtsL
MSPQEARGAARSAPRPTQRVPRRTPLRAVGSSSSKRHLQRRRRAVLLLCCLLAVGSLLAVVGAHAYLTQGQVRLTRVEQKLDDQVNQQRSLELQVAQLEEPSKVLSQAQQQGLVVPSKVTEVPQVTLTPAAGGGSAGR